MKGLIYSWFVTRKAYFIVEAVLFVVACIGMLLILPHIDFSEAGNPGLIAITNFIAVILGSVTMTCGAESLERDLESMIKNRFADYSLSSGLGKRGFARVLLVRNLICVGISLAVGFVLMFIYFFASGQQPSAGLVMLVPLVAFMVNAVDYWTTPLVIKMKNAEKAGLALGVMMGFFILLYMLITNSFETEGELHFNFDLATEIISTCFFAVSYIPVYLITLKMIKRGDLC